MFRLQGLVAVAALLLSPIAADAQEARLIRMATGSPAGVYFPVGIALCRLVNETRAEHGIRCSAEQSAGSVANIAALRSGDVELAIVQSDTQAAAWTGAGEEGPFDTLRSVVSLYPEPLTIVARADAGITGIDGLPGKRLSVGPAGSGQRALWEAVAAAEGWTAESFAEVAELAATDQARALCENRIDAFVTAIGHPALTVQEATLSCDARLVPATGTVADRLVAETPSFFEAEIPGGLYRGNPDAVASFGPGATLVTRADVPDEVISVLVTAIFSKLDRLRGLDPVLADLEPEAMTKDGLTAPLHPAAAAYFSTQGLTN
ncbi:MAG: TAXI family TRAP transporter solute-binding subunit [Rhodobacteraceae bacterium]|nr:TAXI family TRAP transporter solute-binding subunit [Paracoccaceae bacterium]